MMLWASAWAALNVVSASSFVLRLLRPLISVVTSLLSELLSLALSLTAALILELKLLSVFSRRLISLFPRVIICCTLAWLAAVVLVVARALAGMTARLTPLAIGPASRPN